MKRVIKRLRIYKSGGEFLEFIVGSNHTGAGIVKKIEQNKDTFSIHFNDEGVTFVSGFPYVVYGTNK